MPKRETIIQKGILNWLLFHKIFAFRMNTGAYETAYGNYISYGFKGSPDIIGIMPSTSLYPGKFIGVEVKTDKGRQSKEQKQFEERCKACGGIYILARSIDDLEREVKPLLK